MNNSKKLHQKKVKEVKRSERPITSISKPWLITASALIVLLIAGLLFDQLYQVTLMTIDGKKYHMKELAYDFYSVESTYDYYDQMLSGSYWDTAYDEDKGTTMRDKAKEDAIDQILQYEMLYNDAVAKDYKLTDDEKSSVKSRVSSFLSSTSSSVIEKNHFTKARLTKTFSKIALAEDYRKDIIDTLDVDDAAIKAKISFEDYRQYDIEYITVSTQTTDTDGNTTDLSDADKKAAYEKISAIYDKAKASDDWSKLLDDDEKSLSYHTGSFVKGDNTFSEDFEAMMMKMSNNDISQIYEDTTGYYVVRMKDNKSSETYDNQVTQAITEAENTAFDEYYTDKIMPKHQYKLNDKALDKLTMGSITLAN